MLDYDVMISPYGGHGTVHLINRLANTSPRQLVYVRPDTLFKWDVDFSKPPSPGYRKGWQGRALCALSTEDSIWKNLLDLIEHGDRPLVLSGNCSDKERFLSAHDIKALCLIRHPLNAYVSFLSRQHPEHAERFGGFQSTDCVRWYAERWNNIVTDFYECERKRVVRFEHAKEDVKGDEYLERVFGRWEPGRGHGHLLGAAPATLLKSLTFDVFSLFYDNWYV